MYPVTPTSSDEGSHFRTTLSIVVLSAERFKGCVGGVFADWALIEKSVQNNDEKIMALRVFI